MVVGDDHGKRGPQLYDSDKNVLGCKLQIVEDISGLRLGFDSCFVSIQERDGAMLALAKLLGRFRLVQVF